MEDKGFQSEAPNTQQEGQTVEVGVTGVKIASGYVYDEFLPELQGQRGRRKYREMKDNDATVGALLTAIEMILRSVRFRVEPAQTDADNFHVEFVESQFDDMAYTFDDTLAEIMTMLPYGFSMFEMVLKRRDGQNSKYDDGLIGTAKLAPRSQETVWEFDIDEHGELRGINQWPPYGGHSIYIPAERLLHFKTELNKGNPEGRSILRNAYRSYHFIKTIEMVEAIAVERELVGLPVAYIPAKALKDAGVRAKYEQMVRDVKMNSQGGIVMPSDLYKDDDGKLSGQKQYEFKLLSSDGNRSIDTDKVITRHQRSMVRTVLADFLMLGSSEAGSFALSRSKTDLFLKSIEGYLNNIVSVFNNRWITTLWQLNGFDMDKKPKIQAGDIAPKDLEEIGNFLRDTGLSAMVDPKMENFLRELIDAPELEDEQTEGTGTITG